jgi:hypothetical protein
MPLTITWRNPLPPLRVERKVRRVVEDRFETVYLVTGPDAMQGSFELYPGGRTKTDDQRRDVVEAGSTVASSSTQEENGDGVFCGYVAGKQSQEAADPCA